MHLTGAFVRRACMKGLALIAVLVGATIGAVAPTEQPSHQQAFAGALARAQHNQPAEPYPGQGEHREPPQGWVCSRDSIDKAHLCACTGMQQNDKCPHPPASDEADGDANGSTSQPLPPEDAHCKSYCWRDHCHCAVQCET